MATTSNFDITQTAFLFSWVSNAAANQTGTADELAQIVQSAAFTGSNSLLTKYGDQLAGYTWEPVWGPVVFQNTPCSQVADNTAFVVKGSSDSQSIYMVAIAGTNPKSTFAWEHEDLNVDQYVLLESFYPDRSTPPVPVQIDLKNPPLSDNDNYISYGTAIGLQTLCQMQDTSQNTGISLAGFLKQIQIDANTQIVFTGHSLGGALAPTLAYWFRLITNTTITNNIHAMPVAGPTVGSDKYQSDWDSKFEAVAPQEPIGAGNQVQMWNQNVVCNQDVVPHAWTRLYEELHQSTACYFSLPDSGTCTGCSSDSSSNGLLDDINYSLYSNMGTICNCNKLRDYIVDAQVLGSVAYSETSQANKYDEDFTNLMSLTRDKGNVSETPVGGPLDTVCSLNDFAAYEQRLGDTHVWSYGQTAFNIDISVFKNIAIAL